MVTMVTSTRDILMLSAWLKPDCVSTMLPQWVLTLLPTGDQRSQIAKAACLVGVHRADIICQGQVSYVQKNAGIIAFSIKTPRLARALHEFGRECCMTSRASILRTCIMIGMSLPRVELGVMSCTRENPLTSDEISFLKDEAKKLFPGE